MLKFVKRNDLSKRQILRVRITAITMAIVLSGIFIAILGFNPLKVFSSMIFGALGTKMRIEQTITISIPLIITSLGILVAFKMKFWNIGGEGQILMGGFAASYIALNFDFLPKPILLLAMMISGMIGGGIWAFIPAYFKMKFGTNETIFTLMMNYIALKWITYLQFGPWRDPNALGFPKISLFSSNAILPKLFGVHIGWVIALIMTAIIYVFMNYTKKGYEVAVVGESIDTAKYAGMNIKAVVIFAMLMSGGLCGLTGMIQASGVERTLSVTLTGGYGFTAIITTWLSGLSAPLILLTSFAFAVLIQGGNFIQTALQIPQSAADMMQGMILFFILGSEFFIQYRIQINKRAQVTGDRNQKNNE